MRIHAIGFDFLQPYCEEGDVQFVDDPRLADFVLTMNQNGGDYQQTIDACREVARNAGIPFAYWTIEDPNSFWWTVTQAAFADFIFTTDAEMVDAYKRELGATRKVFWLPLAASEKYHRPLPLRPDAADFVFSGNWYAFYSIRDPQTMAHASWSDTVRNPARKWGDDMVIVPLALAGYSIRSFSYEPPPYPQLLDGYQGVVGCRDVAEQYTHGRIVLGQNNQRSWMPVENGNPIIGRTVMTSMRTFETLACGKPLFAPHSDAYKALGFSNGEHMRWSGTVDDTLHWAKVYDDHPEHAQAMGERGRDFVLAHHLYRHRMERIARCIDGRGKAEDWAS